MRKGQSLVEVLIAIAMGALLIIAGATLIAPALQNNKQSLSLQNQTAVAKELSDNVRAWALTNWNGVLGLATGTANQYYLAATTSPFTISTGTQSVTLGSTTYTRYFNLDDVYRDASGVVTTTAGVCAGSSPCYDPSTKRVTVVYGPQGGSTTTLIFDVTRTVGNVASESDWSGGSGVTTSTPQFKNMFVAATSVTYSVAGQLTLEPPAGGSCQQ